MAKSRTSAKTGAKTKAKKGSSKWPPELAKLSPLHLLRLKNFLAEIATRFDGNSAKCAKHTGWSTTFLWQLKHKHRTIGEKTARKIEEKLGLGFGSLDKNIEEQQPKESHYNNGKGQTYTSVWCPEHNLKDLDAEVIVFRACPVPCSTETFCAELVDDEQVEELKIGDWIFVDRALKPKSNSLHVVHIKKKPKGECSVLLAKHSPSRGWIFVPTGLGWKAEDVVTDDEVVCIGRVIFMGRRPTK